MKNISITAIILFITAFGFSQVNGYLGQRLFVSVSGSVLPDLRRVGTDYYEEPLRVPFIDLRFPLAADVNCVISNSVSIGAGVASSNVNANFRNVRCLWNGNNINNEFDYYSAVIYNAKFFSLYLEGHNKFSYSIIDNYFRLGIGMTSIKNISYHDSFIEYPNNWNGSSVLYETELPDKIVSFRLGQKSLMAGIYYEFGNRIPISNHFLLFYGISGYLFPIRNTIYKNSDNVSITNSESSTFITDLGIKRVGNGNMFKFNFGLTMAF